MQKADGPVFAGIDTSNYTTSVAVVSADGSILVNSRKLLEVASGEKGLRQSDALFQHWKVLPQLLEPVLSEYRGRIEKVCCGSKPRPADGSYMPVFTAGTNLGKVMAEALGAEYMELSHQEGHFLAAAYESDIDFSKPVICAHLSGGTLELVLKDQDRYEIVGGTKDISYGQLIDRIGVLFGFDFPAGKYVDEEALKHPPLSIRNPLGRIFKGDTFINLSGTETQIRGIDCFYPLDEIMFYMMERIAESFVAICEAAKEKHGADQVLVSGGVACSGFLRNYCSIFCKEKKYVFGRMDLCSDNAVGEALFASGKTL